MNRIIFGSMVSNYRRIRNNNPNPNLNKKLLLKNNNNKIIKNNQHLFKDKQLNHLKNYVKNRNYRNVHLDLN